MFVNRAVGSKKSVWFSNEWAGWTWSGDRGGSPRGGLVPELIYDGKRAFGVYLASH